MKKIAFLSVALATLFTSCVSKKKFGELENKKNDLENQVYKLNSELDKVGEREKSYKKEVKTLEGTNAALLDAQGEFTTISKQAAENLARSLENIKEKDHQLKSLRDAVNKKDSVNMALVTSFKGALGNLQDEDIQIEVEKGVVFVSISDKLLFDSGSYHVSEKARDVLKKVAVVVNDKPNFEFMVEGHTDTDPIHTSVLEDNWDLSTKRATSIVRVLEEDHGVDPERMTAAGRSEYIPVASNDSSEGKAKNRRTRIVVLPKLDEFYETVEEGMKEAEKNAENDDTEQIEEVQEQLEEGGNQD